MNHALDFLCYSLGTLALVVAFTLVLLMTEEVMNFFKHRFQKPDWLKISKQKSKETI
jgi:hypothetical protein